MSVAQGSELRRRARVLSRMPVADMVLAPLTWLLIGIASTLLLLLPFRRFGLVLGAPLGPVGYVPLATARQAARALMIRRAIARASTLAPFRADCLPQAIAAAVLARALDVPLAIHFGVQFEDGAMKAHAWSASGPVAVSGGNAFRTFTVVSCFAIRSDQRAGRLAQ